MKNKINKDSYKKTLLQQITEPNLRAALEWANEIDSTNSILPGSLRDVDKRAEIVNQLDSNFGIIQATYSADDEAKKDYIKQMAELSRAYMPDVQDDTKRVSIVFKLWAGCLCAAKTIALETRSGPNTPEMRKYLFEELINPLADLDRVYRGGVEAAKVFKDLRNQPCFFDGVPKNAPIIVK